MEDLKLLKTNFLVYLQEDTSSLRLLRWGLPTMNWWALLLLILPGERWLSFRTDYFVHNFNSGKRKNRFWWKKKSHFLLTFYSAFFASPLYCTKLGIPFSLLFHIAMVYFLLSRNTVYRRNVECFSFSTVLCICQGRRMYGILLFICVVIG